MAPISLGISGADQKYLQSFRRNTDRETQSLERLSTGQRINRPSDDPPGFVAAEGLRGDLIDLQAKLKAIGADRQQSHVRQSGLEEIQTALIDLRDKVLTSTDGFLTADERTALKSQVDETIKAVNRIADETGNAAVAGFDSGAAATIQKDDAGAAALVDAQNEGVTQHRAALAADEHANLDTFDQLYHDQAVITTQALSDVEDTDFAAETANFVQSQVLSQGAIVALGYANRQHVDQITHLLDAIA
jgi:flagellin